MTTINDVLPSRWLGAEDLGGRDRTVTIRRFVMEDVQGQKKPVLYLDGEKKGWMINRTNAVTIGKLYGEVLEQWAGKSITLFPAEVRAFGQMWPVIRVRPVRPAVPASNGRAAIPAQPLVPDFDPDDVSDLADEDEGVPPPTPEPYPATLQEAIDRANQHITEATGDDMPFYGSLPDATTVLKAAGFGAWNPKDGVRIGKMIGELVRYGVEQSKLQAA